PAFDASPVTALAGLPSDDLLVVAHGGGTIAALRTGSGKVLWKEGFRDEPPSDIARSPDGKAVACAIVSDLRSPLHLRSLAAGKGGKDDFFRFVTHGTTRKTLQWLHYEDERDCDIPVRRIGYRRDGERLATAGDDGTVRTWRLPDGKWTGE